MKRLLLASAIALIPVGALAQSQGSPTFQNLRILGTVTGPGVGNTAGTVAAGNDPRFSLIPQNYLLNSGGGAILNSGGGKILTLPLVIGTVTGTAGDGGVLATALQSGNNLSDLASAATARTNLGLGGAAVLAAGGAGGAAVLDGSGGLSANLITPTGATTAQTLGVIFSGQTNLKAYGSTQNGTTSDQAAMTAAFSAAPALSTIFVPPGNINPGTFAPTSKQVLWQFSGSYTGSGTTPITGIGINPIQNVLPGGVVYFAKGSTNSGTQTPSGVLRVDETLNNTAGQGSAGGLVAFTVNTATSAGFTGVQSPIAANFSATSGMTATGGAPVTALASIATRASGAGNAEIFGLNSQAYDATGVSSNNGGSIVGAEIDGKANGLADGLSSDGYNVGSGSGAGRFLASLEFGRYDRTQLSNMEFDNGLVISPIDSVTTYDFLKNYIILKGQVEYAALNLRQVAMIGAAQAMVMNTGAGLSWTGAAVTATPTTFATITSSGAAGNENIVVTPNGTGVIMVGATPGVTCSGTPTSSFAATKGIVTHC